MDLFGNHMVFAQVAVGRLDCLLLHDLSINIGCLSVPNYHIGHIFSNY